MDSLRVVSSINCACSTVAAAVNNLSKLVTVVHEPILVQNSVLTYGQNCFWSVNSEIGQFSTCDTSSAAIPFSAQHGVVYLSTQILDVYSGIKIPRNHWYLNSVIIPAFSETPDSRFDPQRACTEGYSNH